MPHIAHIANLWSLVRHPSPTREWSLERKIKAIAAAGFDGLTTAVTSEHRRLAEKHGLCHILGFISSDDPAEFEQLIRGQKEGGAVHINVQLDNDGVERRTAKIARIARRNRMIRAVRRSGRRGESW
jgi:hypothetical protein